MTICCTTALSTCEQVRALHAASGGSVVLSRSARTLYKDILETIVEAVPPPGTSAASGASQQVSHAEVSNAAAVRFQRMPGRVT